MMATGRAYWSFDMDSLNLHWYILNMYNEVILYDVDFQSPAGFVYQDANITLAEDGFIDKGLALGGYNFVVQGNQAYGTVTGLGEFLPGTYNPFDSAIWLVEGIQLSVTDLLNAAITPSNMDDLALVEFALRFNDDLLGSSLADVIRGFSGDDMLRGDDGDDDLYGGPGDDVLIGGLGDDMLDGGADTDTVEYPYFRSEVAVDLISNGVVSVVGGAPNDSDMLYDIERIDLLDGDYVYDIGSDNLGFGYRIYQAAFGRTPDEGGLRFWVGVLDTLDSWGYSEYAKQQYVAREFNESLEFQALYGSNPSHYDYIDAMYQNVLYRLPDQGGYDFWVGGMNQGLTEEDILIAFSESVENRENNFANLDDGVWVV